MVFGTMKRYILAAVATAVLGIGGAASAATVALTDSTRCGAGNAINGIAVTDVTGNAGGASECWGTFDGNDPGPSGDGFQIGSTIYDFVAKSNIGGALEGADIGLTSSTGTSGTWAFDATKWGAGGYGDFIIVLKAASSPGYASWLFTGADAASTFGDWAIAWTTGGGKSTPDLSHISVYATPAPIPVPAAGLLLITALGGLGVAARRRRKSS